MENTTIFAIIISLCAGLSTAIGGLIVFFSNIKNSRLLAFSMSFAAGVMIYVSFVEILPEAQHAIKETHSERFAISISVLLFFLGMFLVYLIEKIVPNDPHKIHSDDDKPEAEQKKKLYKTGILVMIALTIHNFPEGIATFMSSMNDVSVGVMIAFAIALHNIPEGMAVAAPIYYSTGNKWKAFRYSLYSGFAEPLGAIFAFLILGDIVETWIFGYVMSVIAGIMVYISFVGLLPGSWKYGSNKDFINGLVLGMAVMAISLILC